MTGYIAVVRNSSIKQVFLRISQNLQDHTAVSESFFKKYSRLEACNFIKTTLWHGCFLMNFVRNF